MKEGKEKERLPHIFAEQLGSLRNLNIEFLRVIPRH